ncbi:MAG TPA: copper resistance protein CopC [Castellaniella sp.]|uniref:copper resistance CopC/CopD family protein n=1 Tax=Castellaniella sp. TaxID=1955812 RepID=UPI002EDCA831
MKSLIALACCLFIWSQAAFGHAVLVASSPASGAVLSQASQDITLQFNEPVRVTSVRLFDPEGRALATAIRPVGKDGLQLTLPAGTTTAGTYLLSWRVLSADGHPVAGRLEYSVGIITQVPSGALSHTTLARSVAIWFTHWLLYLCVFAVAGAALFRLRRRDSSQDWVRPVAFVGLLLLIVDLALQGMDLLDVPWTALWHMAPWETALSSAHAWTLGLVAIGLLAGLAALDATRPAWLVGGALASALLPSVALAMGAQVAVPHAWAARPLLALHVLIAMIWVGALVPLYRRLQPLGQPGQAASRRHGAPESRFGLSAPAWLLLVALPLVVTGLALAILQLGRWQDLWQTDFGSVLLMVMVLAAVLLFVAVRNRVRLAACGPNKPLSVRTRVRRSLGTEIILSIGILSVVSLWHFAPPSHESVVAHEPQGPVFALENQTARALIELPLQGAGAWRIQVISIDGEPLDIQQVVLTLGNPEAGIAPEEHEALRQPDGRWRVDLPALTAAGPWQVTVMARVGVFRQITLQRDLVLPKPVVPATAPHS